MSKRELPLPRGKNYYAVIDVEALVIGSIVNVVEQVAFVLYDLDGREVWAEKHWIYQPYDCLGLTMLYGVQPSIVEKSMEAYRRITGDEPVHADALRFTRWADVRRHVQRSCRFHAAAVYAKGIQLESSVFYGTIDFRDLAWWGCPKYPLALHDPLSECRFFANYIPEIRARALERSWFRGGK